MLSELEPQALGLYWPYRSEFNAVATFADDSNRAKLALALPFAQRAPVRMHYRAWSGATPTSVDDCGIPCADGAPVVPDVVLAPCVGFTADGYRLGYGGGYFDRWLAEHPHVTSVGVAWSVGEVDAPTFDAQPHDRRAVAAGDAAFIDAGRGRAVPRAIVHSHRGTLRER